MELYEEAIQTGSLGSDINAGLIKLVPKDGDKLSIKTGGLAHSSTLHIKSWPKY